MAQRDKNRGSDSPKGPMAQQDTALLPRLGLRSLLKSGSGRSDVDPDKAGAQYTDPAEPRARVVIEQVSPEVDAGHFPIKRVAGDWVTVTADIFADGHDRLAARLRFRRAGDPRGPWQETRMREVVNDQWTGRFRVTEAGRYEYTIIAWVDRFESWRHDLAKKIDAGQDVSVDLLAGIELVADAEKRASREDAEALARWTQKLVAILPLKPSPTAGAPLSEAQLALDESLAELVSRHSERRFATSYGKNLGIIVDRERARFSAWYEMFPRSAATVPGVHGTFRDCEARLPYIAGMGFDVLYLPPIHPIGRRHRKGKNNAAVAGVDDVGSPWAIGAAEGGHKAIHPQLGTLDDFRRLVGKCRDFGMEIALDLAYQCAPDHPYAGEHPEWFRSRPDGSIQYAENPPKKYEDIYPFDFESEAWADLVEELKSVVLFWIDQGVCIFRVDNPHTKPFRFWEWLIGDIKSTYPDVLFLAEAFTRPKIMYRLAKLGFSQSYTYFAWRNTRRELTEYFTELATTGVREYFRPHLWPNTPDILTEYLQTGGRPAFAARLVLAATLGTGYGIYGPAFELCENRPLVAGKEEYLDAEKYQIRNWDLAAPGSLRELITRVNRARRENPALQSDDNLVFHPTDNDHLIAYSKATADRSSVVLTIVNLDPKWAQAGWTDLRLDALGLVPGESYTVEDLLTGARYAWQGARNFVRLDPSVIPAHVFRVP